MNSPKPGTPKFTAAVLVAALTCVAVMGCGKDCTPNTESPSVLVVDSDTKEPVCSATVELTSSDGNTKVLTTAGDNPCVALVPEEPGEYTATVTAPGYDPTTDHVSITADDCGTISAEPDGPRDGYPGYGLTVTIAITPSAN